MKNNHQEKLASGLNALGLALDEAAQQKLLLYLEMLQKWNKAYNLTAITDFDKMITHHLLDSLSVIPHLKGKRILDVGTGAGLPGIPLAIALPDHDFTLLDSNGKKVRFLLQASAELKLGNIKALQSRIEDYRAEACFDVIISRAVGAASMLIDNSRTLLCNDGRYLLMKGKYPEDEVIPGQYVSKIIELKVPGLDASRHLIIIMNEESR
jgi:16S rRNA (guanine527-N7)-methyltransferase